jgi:pimeloyl-ACP methyl ester carboxylesterase
MKEQEIHFRSGEAKLAGTMTLPESGGPFPGVLLLTGSGEVDRNENSRKISINAFFDLSHYLAQSGIASLRYDKRGIGESTGDYWETGFYDRNKDAMAALRFFKQQKSIQPDNIYLLGHSEGAFIATHLAGDGAGVAGIILIAGGAQAGEDVLKWQATQLASRIKGVNGWLIKALHIDVVKTYQKQVDKIKRSRKNWYRQELFLKVNAKWLREFLEYNPAGDFPRIRVPVLAIAGSKDLQVNPADLERMSYLLKAPFEKHLIPGMTHILRVEEGEPSISKYREEIKKPLEPQVLEIVRHWLESQIHRESDIITELKVPVENGGIYSGYFENQRPHLAG